MPIYDLIDTNTNEVFEKTFKLCEYEQFLSENPHIKRYYSKPNLAIDSIALGRTKPPRDFQDNVIGRIKRNTPGHNIQSRWD